MTRHEGRNNSISYNKYYSHHTSTTYNQKMDLILETRTKKNLPKKNTLREI